MNEPRAPKVQVAFECPAELAARAEAIAERELMSRAAWLRRLLAKATAEVAA